MYKEINPGEAMFGVQRLLQKYCKNRDNMPEPRITLTVYYKPLPNPFAVQVENADVNELQRKASLNLLFKMIQSEELLSKTYGRDTDVVGAIASRDMIIVLAGVEHLLAQAIIAKALHSLHVIDDSDYRHIKKKLGQEELFKILEE